jgi:hypothetical protein
MEPHSFTPAIHRKSGFLEPLDLRCLDALRLPGALLELISNPRLRP